MKIVFGVHIISLNSMVIYGDFRVIEVVAHSYIIYD